MHLSLEVKKYQVSFLSKSKLMLTYFIIKNRNLGVIYEENSFEKDLS